MSDSAKLLLGGQLLLIVCCALYIPWWFRVFVPGGVQDWTGGGKGMLLSLTAASGLCGAVLSLVGMNHLRLQRSIITGGRAALIGVIAYFAVMVVTRAIWSRPVTTELFLITGWTVLEIAAVNALYGGGVYSLPRAGILMGLVLASYAAGIVLYVLYYQVEPWPAYYLAAVPLGLDAVVMALVVLAALL